MEIIVEVYKQIKEWFWALKMWKKAIISSLIGAFGGASVIHFFNTYALYVHAYYQGFRVPVEGVEYLSLAVSLVSFIFFLISFGGSILLYFVLKKLSNASWKYWIRRNGDGESRTTKIFGIIQLTFLFIINTIFMKNSPSILFAIIFSSILGMFFIVTHFVREDSSIKIFVLAIISIGMITITALLFYQPFYKEFLKKIQYGGELSVNIEYRKADNTESNVKGLLLIRTNKSIILKDSISENQFEIPTERVSKITFLKEE
jgi:hypothetical protein